MAFDYTQYQGFATLGVNLNRQKYGPLDFSQLFLSKTDLDFYCQNTKYSELSTITPIPELNENWKTTVPYPYPGQVVALYTETDKSVRILKLTEKLTPEGEVVTNEKGNPQFEYSDVGKVPVGDGKSIEVADDGTISIHGFLSAENGSQLVKVGDQVVWQKPDTTTIEGLTTTVNAISADIYTPKTGLSAKVEANISAINILNGDEKVEGSVAKQIADAISTVIGGAPEAFDTLKEIADWISSDVSGTSALIAEIGTIKTNVNTISTDVSVLNAGDSVVGSVAHTAISAANAAITNANLSQYATKTEVEASVNELDGKITGLDTRVTTAEGKITANEKQLTAINQTIGTLRTDVDSKVSAVTVNGVSAVNVNHVAVITIAEGDTDGTIKVQGKDVAVHGLGSAAYTVSTDYVLTGNYETDIDAINEAINAISANISSNIDGEIADISEVIAEISSELSTKVDKIAGHSLVSDTLSAKLGRILDISAVNTNEFTTTNGKLEIKEIAANKVTGLDAELTGKVDKVTNANVGNLAEFVTGGNIKDTGYSIVTLSSAISTDYVAKDTALSNALDDKIKVAADAIKQHIEEYEGAISVGANNLVTITNLSVAGISSESADFVTTNVTADKLTVKNLSAINFTEEAKTLAKILEELQASTNAAIQELSAAHEADLTWQTL